MRTVGRKCVQFAAHIRCAKVLSNGHLTAELLLTISVQLLDCCTQLRWESKTKEKKVIRFVPHLRFYCQSQLTCVCVSRHFDGEVQVWRLRSINGGDELQAGTCTDSQARVGGQAHWFGEQSQTVRRGNWHSKKAGRLGISLFWLKSEKWNVFFMFLCACAHSIFWNEMMLMGMYWNHCVHLSRICRHGIFLTCLPL